MRWLLLFVVSVSLSAQVATEANESYSSEQFRQNLAKNLDDPERVERDKPDRLVAELGLQKGDVVADIGSGVGFMIPFFLEAIGPEGKLYAEDIQQDFLDKIEEKKQERGWDNVETVLGDERSPNLPEGTLDLAFALDAYHHFNYPEETLALIRAAIKPGGRLVIVDFYRSRPHPRMSPERLAGHIRKDRDGFAAEIQAAGFELIRIFDQLPYQYALVFRRGD